MHADRRAGGKALGEVVALHHPRHGVARGELDHPAGAKRVAPLAVVAHLGALDIDHQPQLGKVGRGVGLDLLARQRRPRRVAPRGVTDHRGEVADQRNHRVAHLL